MITVTRTIRTDTPLEKSWGFLKDFTSAEQWDPGTVTCRRLGDGPIDVGTRYENVSEFRGRRTTLIYEVIQFEVARRLVLKGENKTVQSIDDMTFSGSTTGTEVLYTARFTFKGAVRLAEPFLRRPLNKLADDAEAGLQKALDAL